MIKIQERDQRTQALVYEQRFLKTKHVQEAEFRGCHPSEAYRRLQQLVSAGFLKAVRPYSGSREIVYVLTEKGVGEARKRSEWDISYKARLIPSLLEHDTLVTMVRIRMCQTMGGKWIPEAVLRSRAPRPEALLLKEQAIGDGIFLRPDGARIVIELENSVKERKRYERLLRLWSERDDVDLVLYIATEPMIARRLQSMMDDIAPQLPRLQIGLVLYDDLFKDWPLPVKQPGGESGFLHPRNDLSKGVENATISN